MKRFRLVILISFLVGCSQSEPKPETPANGPTQPAHEPGPADSPPSATDQAIELVRDGRVEEAVTRLEEHLKGEANDASAKALLAQCLQLKAQPATQEGRWDLAGPWLLESSRLAREVRSVKGLNANVEGLYVTATYNEACVYSRRGDVDKALDSLEESLQAGFLDQTTSTGPTPRELLVADPDLDAIRDTDRFRELKDRYLKEEKPAVPPSHDPSAG